MRCEDANRKKALHTARHKPTFLRACERAGVRVPDWRQGQRAEELDPPTVVKPASGGKGVQVRVSHERGAVKKSEIAQRFVEGELWRVFVVRGEPVSAFRCSGADEDGLIIHGRGMELEKVPITEAPNGMKRDAVAVAGELGLVCAGLEALVDGEGTSHFIEAVFRMGAPRVKPLKGSKKGAAQEGQEGEGEAPKDRPSSDHEGSERGGDHHSPQCS